MPRLEEVGALDRIERTYLRWKRRLYPWMVGLVILLGAWIGYGWSIKNLGWNGTLIMGGVLLAIVIVTVAVMVWMERAKGARSEARLRALLSPRKRGKSGDRDAG